MPTTNQLVTNGRSSKIKKQNAPALNISYNSLIKKAKKMASP
ncbi:30S ribosomal protein S12, partial [Mycoplasmopsis pullorum]